MARTRQWRPGGVRSFQRPKYEKPPPKLIRLPDSADPTSNPDQKATSYSSTLLAKLPLEILHEILTLAFANDLWSSSVKAPFFRYVEFKAAVFASYGVAGVSREWRAVVRSMIFTSRVRREGVLLGIQVQDIVRALQLFLGISGCAVFLGDPNNIPLLESNLDMLCQLSQSHPGGVDFVTAVEWCIPTQAQRRYRLELPLRVACEQECTKIFGTSEFWQRRVDPEILVYLIEELSEFMLWHTSLIVSILELFQCANYVDIPAFVFGSTRDLDGNRALYADLPHSDSDRTSDEDETTRDTDSTFETSRVLAIMGKEPVPSHRRSCAFFADLVQRTRYLHITTFPNALQGLFACGFLPADFLELRRNDVELRRNDITGSSVFNWGRRMESLIGFRLHDMTDCVQYPDGLFSKLEGFGVRGMEFEERYNYENMRKNIWRQPGITTLKEFHTVYHREGVKDNVPDYGFLRASASSLTSITIDVDIRGENEDYSSNDDDAPTGQTTHYCTFFTSPKNFPNLQTLDIRLDQICPKIFDTSHPCLRKMCIKSTLDCCPIEGKYQDWRRMYKQLDTALSLSVAARESLVTPADVDLELHLWNGERKRFDVTVSTLVLRPLEHKVSCFSQECSRRNRGFTALQTELVWSDEGSFAVDIAEKLLRLDLDEDDWDTAVPNREWDGDWVSWLGVIRAAEPGEGSYSLPRLPAI